MTEPLVAVGISSTIAAPKNLALLQRPIVTKQKVSNAN